VCAGYSVEADVEALVDAFQIDQTQTDMPVFLPGELYPRQSAPIIVARVTDEGVQRVLGLSRFGLVPHWAKELAVGNKLFNARAETLSEKPAFRDSFARRRCLVPVSAFYEWQKDAAGKSHRYRFAPAAGGLWALAGLWSTWRGPDGDKVGSFAIITTSPNGVIAPIHDRMPVVLPEASHGAWLSPASDPAALRSWLVPCPDEWVTMENG
jgi:putative SOS response-associated peptidase YedK